MMYFLLYLIICVRECSYINFVSLRLGIVGKDVCS